MLSDEHRAHTNRRHSCVPIKPLPGSTASALILIYVASVEVETCLLQTIRYRDSPFRFEMLTSTIWKWARYTNSQRLVVLFSLLVIAVCFLNSQRLVVFVCFLPIHSGHQVRWTYQPGSHRRKVTHCYIPSSVAVHYLKTELTYLSSQSLGVSIHHSTIIARVIICF